MQMTLKRICITYFKLQYTQQNFVAEKDLLIKIILSINKNNPTIYY